MPRTAEIIAVGSELLTGGQELQEHLGHQEK